MRKTIFIIFLIAICLSSFAQSKDEMDLFSFKSNEDEFARIEKIKVFQIENPFNVQALYFICRYYEKNYIDSVAIFFDNLSVKYPKNIEPWLIRAESTHYEFDFQNDSLHLHKKLEYLKKALKIDNNSFEVNYKIAKLYYDDFISSMNQISIKEIEVYNWPNMNDKVTKSDTSTILGFSYFNHPEDSVLFYFNKIQNLNNSHSQFLYFPKKQINTYKNIISESKIDSLMGLSENCYFPSWYFINLPPNWESNFNVNYLNELENSMSHIDYIKSRLEVMNEPCLYGLTIPDDLEIYRFTWLRSFQNPICIRIEKNKDNIQLFLKITNGDRCVHPNKLIKSKKRNISILEWNYFKELLNLAEFDKLPKRKDYIMCDGVNWILEHKTSTIYKVHETNIPSEYFEDACNYLIKLSKYESRRLLKSLSKRHF